MQAIDLFSGAGGMSLGAIACGIDIKYAVEIESNAAKTYIRNHPNTTMLAIDIKQVTSDMFSQLNRNESIIIFGGPPCQGFSTSNQKNRNIDNDKNWLFKEYFRLVREIKPQWVVFENVRGIVETEKGFFLSKIIENFTSFGYVTSTFILNAAHYGVPQNRNRLFIIASLEGYQIDPPPATVQKPITVKEAISDLPKVINGHNLSKERYSFHAKSQYAKEMRGNLKNCENNIVTRNSDHIIERYKHIPQGGNWENIPSELMKNYTDVSRCHTGIYRRLKNDEPSVVIGNYRKNMLIHPVEDRGLSVREAARLQSFPDNFVFEGTLGSQQQQVGNAVPPLLARAIFEAIKGVSNE